MKLWQKVSVISIAILLVVVITCGALLLSYASDNILQITKTQAQKQQQSLLIAFTEMAGYYVREGDAPIAKQSAIKYCFTCFADETSVLVYAGETLYSRVSLQPEQLLPLNHFDDISYWGRQETLLEEIDGRNILIVGGRTSVHLDVYDVYVVEDITDIFNSIVAMTWRFVLISCIGIGAGIVFMILLVRRATRPLVRLKNTARRIAQGEYNERSDIHSNDEVGELATDFNAMAGAVEEYVESLRDTAARQQLFIGGLTHEFKTPMTSILIHTDTLLNTNLNAEQAESSLLHINRQCKWLESLTQKLLKLIALGGEIQVKQESVPELFDDVSCSMTETLHDRSTPLAIENNIATLDMDYDLMKSLLINLIDNASKASVPGQEIRLRAFENILEVSDDGRGMPETEIPRVTDAFYMVDRSRSKAQGGSGLGLALAHQIALAHHAELWIESEAGRGTTVRIIFPITKS